MEPQHIRELLGIKNCGVFEVQDVENELGDLRFHTFGDEVAGEVYHHVGLGGLFAIIAGGGGLTHPVHGHLWRFANHVRQRILSAEKIGQEVRFVRRDLLESWYHDHGRIVESVELGVVRSKGVLKNHLDLLGQGQSVEVVVFEVERRDGRNLPDLGPGPERLGIGDLPAGRQSADGGQAGFDCRPDKVFEVVGVHIHGHVKALAAVAVEILRPGRVNDDIYDPLESLDVSHHRVSRQAANLEEVDRAAVSGDGEYALPIQVAGDVGVVRSANRYSGPRFNLAQGFASRVDARCGVDGIIVHGR